MSRLVLVLKKLDDDIYNEGKINSTQNKNYMYKWITPRKKKEIKINRKHFLSHLK
jgi:hypothetical protein